MGIERFCFASKNFVSGQQVRFTIIDDSNVTVFNGLATEWGTSGTYYVNFNFASTKNYLIIATEITGKWKAARLRKKV
jgi:hypothetical protein